MKPTRRQLIVGTGAISIGTVGTILTTQNAEAVSIAIGELTIPDANHTGEVNSVEVEVQAETRWKDAKADTLEIALAAGESENRLTELDVQSKSLSENNGTHTTDLRDDVLESSSLSKGSFELAPGQPQKQVDIAVQLRARLMRSDETLVANSVTETATVTITAQTAEITLGGTGELIIS